MLEWRNRIGGWQRKSNSLAGAFLAVLRLLRLPAAASPVGIPVLQDRRSLAGRSGAPYTSSSLSLSLLLRSSSHYYYDYSLHCAHCGNGALPPPLHRLCLQKEFCPAAHIQQINSADVGSESSSPIEKT